MKRYSYDRCAIVTPPPYFPTTGRLQDNRYYELNPVGFSAATLYKSITPDPGELSPSCQAAYVGWIQGKLGSAQRCSSKDCKVGFT